MMRLPSAVVVTNVGYQPVGRNPSGRLLLAILDVDHRHRVVVGVRDVERLPSGDSASEFGVLPAGAFGPSAVLITSSRCRDFRSNAMTLFVLPHDTKRRPSVVTTTSFGCGSVASVPAIFGRLGSLTSTIATFAIPRFATYSVLPSFESRADSRMIADPQPRDRAPAARLENVEMLVGVVQRVEERAVGATCPATPRRS